MIMLVNDRGEEDFSKFVDDKFAWLSETVIVREFSAGPHKKRDLFIEV